MRNRITWVFQCSQHCFCHSAEQPLYSTLHLIAQVFFLRVAKYSIVLLSGVAAGLYTRCCLVQWTWVRCIYRRCEPETLHRTLTACLQICTFRVTMLPIRKLLTYSVIWVHHRFKPLVFQEKSLLHKQFSYIASNALVSRVDYMHYVFHIVGSRH